MLLPVDKDTLPISFIASGKSLANDRDTAWAASLNCCISDTSSIMPAAPSRIASMLPPATSKAVATPWAVAPILAS